MVASPFLWIFIIPLITSPIAYLLGRFTYHLMGKKQHINLGAWVTLAGLLATLIPLINLTPLNGEFNPQTYLSGMISFRFDGISLLISYTAVILGALSVIFSTRYLEMDAGQEKFYALFLLMVGSIIGLSMAADLFLLWIWFEQMAISTYTLVAFYRTQKGSLEAGVKYLVQSALGSVLVLLGIALVFGQTGTLDLRILQSHTFVSPGLLVAGVLFLVGFGIKAALVPLHTWLPDAHSQAPSSISAMLSGIVIEAGLIALLRVLVALNGISLRWGPILLGLGAINMLVGNLMALRQDQIKRLLAYSSISHIGYMLAGLGAAFTFGSLDGAQGGFFHLLTHGLMKGLAFLSAGALLYTLVIHKGEHRPLVRADLNGASKRFPLEALAFSIAVLALGGLPPLAGFMSKWQIFSAGITTHNPWLLALVIFMALNSVLSLGYYAPLVNALYRRKTSESTMQAPKTGVLLLIPVVLLTLAVVIVGFYPPVLTWLSNLAGSSMILSLGL
jgi:proton-translocating NADH-quinone oxidoreductase chain N